MFDLSWFPPPAAEGASPQKQGQVQASEYVCVCVWTLQSMCVCVTVCVGVIAALVCACPRLFVRAASECVSQKLI